MSGYHRIAFTSLGVFDPKIEELASRARRDVKRGNVSRNLHFYIHKKNMTLPVATSSVVIPIKARVSRRFAVARKPWPVFHLSSWIKTAMETKPFEGFFLLAGMKLDKLAQAEDALELFWSRYKAVDPNTPDYPRRTLPFYIHGDEGRSQVKRNTLTTRMLYTLLPSENYAPNGASTQALMAELVKDCNKLYTEGIDVSWNGQRLKFYARFCGVKGDWPWLRTCYKLSTGFTSKRICHECPSNDWTDLSRSGSTRSWPRNGVAPSPFKPGRRAAIRNMLPSGGHRTIRIDIAHTYAIAGWGKDQLASLLVLCAVRANLWGRAGYEEQLRRAFESFQEWCRVHSKTSTVLDFSKKELKISSLQSFPRGLGKGSDAALVGGWLESVLTPVDPQTVPEECRDMIIVAKWGIAATGRFFRIIYSGELWLTRAQAQAAVCSGFNMIESYGALARLARLQKWRLFYMRPKVHMNQHVLFLGSGLCFLGCSLYHAH
ncbi:unnamed protein product [Cladocopium goreaui]|uniref:Uncharacterized protein n=1 Tax=Cladocopium goreaui TaxID=2562237 RepID=A0A9P1G9G0_9DINO|nr:unnamed protein product [Cladocopium goreaui]